MLKRENKHLLHKDNNNYGISNKSNQGFYNNYNPNINSFKSGKQSLYIESNLYCNPSKKHESYYRSPFIEEQNKNFIDEGSRYRILY